MNLFVLHIKTILCSTMTMMNNLEQAKDATTRYLDEKLREREHRMRNPEFVNTVENLKESLIEDLGKACTTTLAASWKLTLGTPLNTLYEGFIGKPVETFAHNMKEKDPKKKKAYPHILESMFAELLTGYVKGTWNIFQVVGHLAKAIGRTAVLGYKYTTGK